MFSSLVHFLSFMTHGAQRAASSSAASRIVTNSRHWFVQRSCVTYSTWPQQRVAINQDARTQHSYICKITYTYTRCPMSRASRASSAGLLAASSRSFAEFSQEHLSLNPAEERQTSAKIEREYEAAKSSAAGSLSLRPHSRQELEIKLRDKGYSESAICRALDRLQELEVQSDADYAEVYTRSKWRQSRWAPSRIQQELLRKGVAREDCQTALESAFGEKSRSRFRVNLDNLEEEDQGMSSLFGTEGRIDQQLLASARRQADMTQSLPSETRRRRLTGWLVRRGHDWDIVSKIIALLKI